MAVTVHDTAIVGPNVRLGDGTVVEPYCVLGDLDGSRPVTVGAGSVLRCYTRIEGGVTVGPGFRSGNHALLRGNVTVGAGCLVGSYSSVEGDVTVGDHTMIRGRCEIPNSRVGARCQIYAGVQFYDTPRPPHGPNLPPVIEDDVVIGCNAAILGGVTVGQGSMVAANTLVLADVPAGMFVKRTGEMVPRR